MKKLFIVILLTSFYAYPKAQTAGIIHRATFKKGSIGMSSHHYKPDNWEKPYYDSSLKSVFPSDLIKNPEKYADRLVHLMGIVDSVYIDSNSLVTLRLENKYWDYIEDYSIQDEKMFISEKGDGKFLVSLSTVAPDQLEEVKKFPAENKLLIVYGDFKGLADGLPNLAARQIKYIDYEFYTTKVFSYEILRNKNGEVVTDKKGRVQLTNFTFLKIAKAGQNK